MKTDRWHSLSKTSGRSPLENARPRRLVRTRARLLVPLLLLLWLPLGCGDGKELQPNPPGCPAATPVSGATCTKELEKKSCYWDDAVARLRTWCFCEQQTWSCFDDPL